MATDVTTLAELIAAVSRADEAPTFDSLLEEVKGLPEAAIVESTEEGRKEFGRLVMRTKRLCQIANPYEGRPSKRSARGIKAERRLASRDIAYDKLAMIIKEGPKVNISTDSLQKICEGGEIHSKTLFRLLAAKVVLHPCLDRAITTDEAIALLRQEATIESLARDAGGTATSRRLPPEKSSRRKRHQPSGR